MATNVRNHRSHRNPTVDSLYLAPGNFVRPEEESAWKTFNASFWDSLAASGPVEAFLVTEITRAAWRLRRCNNVEASLINRLSDPTLDPMEDPATRDSQNAVDRARSQAERSMERSLAELRRIQTERQYRNESLPEGTDLTNFGMASFKQIEPALRKTIHNEPLRIAKPAEGLRPPVAPRPATEVLPVEIAPQIATGTARNAPCPCGSGQKHKRCCGRNAPAVLGAPLSLAA
jgi:hypothetical protein